MIQWFMRKNKLGRFNPKKKKEGRYHCRVSARYGITKKQFRKDLIECLPIITDKEIARLIKHFEQCGKQFSVFVNKEEKAAIKMSECLYLEDSDDEESFWYTKQHFYCALDLTNGPKIGMEGDKRQYYISEFFGDVDWPVKIKKDEERESSDNDTEVMDDEEPEVY